jgi:hypothetical protein
MEKNLSMNCRLSPTKMDKFIPNIKVYSRYTFSVTDFKSKGYR